MIVCKNKNTKTLHFYSIIIIIKICIIGSHLMRAKENKLLSGSNLFPHMMWIKFSWKIGFHLEHWGQILTRESILMWVQQHRRQPGEQEIVRPTLNRRESSRLPQLADGLSDSQHFPKVLQCLQASQTEHTVGKGKQAFLPFFQPDFSLLFS